MNDFYIEDKHGRRLVIEHQVAEEWEEPLPKLYWGGKGDRGTGVLNRERAERLLKWLNPVHEAVIIEPEPEPEAEPETLYGRAKAAVVRYVRPNPAVLCPKCGAADPKIKKKEGLRRLHWCDCGEHFWSNED